MKRILALIAALAILTGLGVAGSPAQASVPDWDKAGYSAEMAETLKARGFTVKTPAEWAAISTTEYGVARKAPTDCPFRPPWGTAETLCLWNGYGWSGTRWNIPLSWLGDRPNVNVPFNGLSFYGSGINNASKSWYNQTYYDIRLFDRDDCQNSGWYRTLGAGEAAVSYDASTNDWENRIGSASILQYAGSYCTNVPGQ